MNKVAQHNRTQINLDRLSFLRQLHTYNVVGITAASHSVPSIVISEKFKSRGRLDKGKAQSVGGAF